MVDYNDDRPQFKGIGNENDEQKLKSADLKKPLLHPTHVNEISQYIY